MLRHSNKQEEQRAPLRFFTLAEGAKGREAGCTTSFPLLCSRTMYSDSRREVLSIGTKEGIDSGMVSQSSTVLCERQEGGS
jgi:hypothetical protein